MSRYVNLKVRVELVELLKRCQREGEPLSDTLKALLDPVRVHEREREARSREDPSLAMTLRQLGKE